MKRINWKISLFLLLFGWLFNFSCFASTAVPVSLAPMLQKVLPAVVNVRAAIKITSLDTMMRLQQERKNLNGPIPDKLMSVASGVIVDAGKGYILTNAHVIDDAESVTVSLSDGRHFTAKIIGIDKPSDVGLLQIQAKNLTAATFGNSNELKVGDVVAAIGNPFGLNQTVTSGIVSALGRTTLGIESFENFIQTDAPINPGNSGGALINIQGQLIGINTAILAPDRGSVGIGFAIPVDMAKSVMQQLIEFGNVRRGMLGIGAQDITPEIADAFNVTSPFKGAVVTMVMPHSPADSAGIHVGDIVTTINGTEIKNANDVVNSIGFMRVDSRAVINLLRDHKSMTVTAMINDPKKRRVINEQLDPFLYGVSLKNFSVDSAEQGEIKGVLVVNVEEDSSAWRSDLRPGDIITSAGHNPVGNIAELRKIATDAKHDLLLNVLRGSGAVFLVISKEP